MRRLRRQLKGVGGGIYLCQVEGRRLGDVDAAGNVVEHRGVLAGAGVVLGPHLEDVSNAGFQRGYGVLVGVFGLVNTGTGHSGPAAPQTGVQDADGDFGAGAGRRPADGFGVELDGSLAGVAGVGGDGGLAIDADAPTAGVYVDFGVILEMQLELGEAGSDGGDCDVVAGGQE